MPGGRLNLSMIRSLVQRKSLIVMAPQFVDLTPGPNGASGTYIATVTDSVEGLPIHGLMVSLEINGVEVTRERTDGLGQISYNFKLDQSGKYNFVAYAVGDVRVNSLILTPSVSLVLGVRAIAVNTVDASTGDELSSTVKITGNESTVQSNKTVAGTNPYPTPYTGLIVDSSYNTPLLLFVPTQAMNGAVITISVDDAISNGQLGLVGVQNNIGFSLGSDITATFNYLPFKTILISGPPGIAVVISGDEMGRFSNIRDNEYQIMMGYSISLMASPSDNTHVVLGWIVNGKSTVQPVVNTTVNDDINAQAIGMPNTTSYDYSTFETGIDGWSAIKPQGQVIEAVVAGVLVVTNQGDTQLFGAWKSYNIKPGNIVHSLHITCDFSTIGSNPIASIYVVHGNGVSFDDNGKPINVHSVSTIGSAGHIDQDIPITGHIGGNLSVFIAVQDNGRPVQTQLLLENVLVTWVIPPPVPTTIPVIGPIDPANPPPPVTSPGLPPS